MSVLSWKGVARIRYYSFLGRENVHRRLLLLGGWPTNTSHLQLSLNVHFCTCNRESKSSTSPQKLEVAHLPGFSILDCYVSNFQWRGTAMSLIKYGCQFFKKDHHSLSCLISRCQIHQEYGLPFQASAAVEILESFEWIELHDRLQLQGYDAFSCIFPSKLWKGTYLISLGGKSTAFESIRLARICES